MKISEVNSIALKKALKSSLTCACTLNRFIQNEEQAPRITSVQYCGGCSVLQRLFSTAGGSISTAEAVQYCGGIASVLQGDSISTAGG